MDTEISRMERLLSLAAREEIEADIPQQLWQKGQKIQGHMIVGRIATKRRVNYRAMVGTLTAAFNSVKKLEFRKLDEERFMVIFDHVSFYIQILDFPISQVNEEMAEFLGNRIRAFIEADSPKNGASWGPVLRMKVSINVTKPLQLFIKLQSPASDSFWVRIVYERLPIFCFLCGVIGHTKSFCGLRYSDDFIEPESLPFGAFLRAPSLWRPITQFVAPARLSSADPPEGGGQMEPNRGQASGKQNLLHSSPSESSSRSVLPGGNPNHRRSVAACLVQGVYILERDRQEKRGNTQALAPPWWKSFHFHLYRLLIDDIDSCIFGAIYQLTSTPLDPNNSAPRYVIAFRGTITKGDAFTRDFELDIHIIKNGLHQTSRFETAIQTVRHVVATYGSSNVWSLRSAMAMLAGKNMAKTGVYLEAFLFNPPFLSSPIEKIKDKKVKHGIRFAGSLITAGLALAMKNNNQTSWSGGTFSALSTWLPSLFVNPADHICSEYVGYFEHRKRMDEMGAGGIERLTTQHSIGGLLMNVMGVPSEEPFHLYPICESNSEQDSGSRLQRCSWYSPVVER
ncbi:hypothetical protein BUALT_Bualt15G0103500 [Buddleja alternifolia]|uniref:Zinc knuckle CX2CX4HX4C domain-containing protein n=1 Tax=Buddleja alternifolia TaxID=168488 RepID=A0AAV6WFL0_9LAMI|nr:hypothetical protein BUALT_Bualt15G0103500 [Buddleja alternifolia]